jgi:hypothetical protein
MMESSTSRVFGASPRGRHESQVHRVARLPVGFRRPGQGMILRAIKLVHTAIWAFFAGCILAIPLFAQRGELTIAAALVAVVGIEVLVLALNGMRCPLTGVAARQTDERQDNFDIFLPVWLARHNKAIFGTLYVAGILYTVAKWIA